MASDDVLVRRCEETDLAAVAQLQAALAAEEALYGFEADSIDELRLRLGPLFLVACSASQLVGYVFGTILTSEGMAVIPAGTTYVSVDELYVDPGWRDQGLGSRLLDAILDVAAADGVSRSLVYSANRDLARVMRFYERSGFQSWCVLMFR